MAGVAFKFAKTFYKSRLASKAKLIGAAGLGGTAVGFSHSEPGLRSEGTKEGLSFSLLTGALAFSIGPKVGGLAVRHGRRAARKGIAKGQIVFRKIRGRIVPIRRR